MTITHYTYFLTIFCSARVCVTYFQEKLLLVFQFTRYYSLLPQNLYCGICFFQFLIQILCFEFRYINDKKLAFEFVIHFQCYFLSVTIRLLNQFCKFADDGTLEDIEQADVFLVFVLILSFFTTFHLFPHLFSVISISITACWFLTPFLRHWFSFSRTIIFS